MNIKYLFRNILWLLHKARTFSPVKFYYYLRNYSGRPTPFPIQFKTRKHDTDIRLPAKIDEGALNVPFSALDEHGIIRGQTDVGENARPVAKKEAYKNEKIKFSATHKEKIPAPGGLPETKQSPSVEGAKLQEQFLREAIESVEKPNPEFPFLDCLDLHHRLTIVGIRNGHMHILARNALGKTFKAEVHDMFDTKGRLKVKGLSLRLPIFTSSGNAPPVYRKAGTIDLTSYVGLTAHTLAQLEDALNEGITRLRKNETEPEAFAATPKMPQKKSLPTLTLLQNIRSLLSRSKTQGERRSYADRRAGDDRRAVSRRVENDRRSGIDRRLAKETSLKEAMLVKEEEYRKDERRKNERRSEADRRLIEDRRKVNERRKELHITSQRSQYIYSDPQTLLAYIADSWNSNEKLEAEEIILNPRGDVSSMHLFLDNSNSKLAIQGEKGTPCETFITPLVGMPVLIRSNTDVTLHCVTGSKGFLRFKPTKKTGAAITVLVPEPAFVSAIIEISNKGLRKILLGTLTLEVSKLHKDCILMTPDGKQYLLNNADDAQKIGAAIKSAAGQSSGTRGEHQTAAS